MSYYNPCTLNSKPTHACDRCPNWKCQDHHLTIKTKGTTKRTHGNVAEFVDAGCGCPYSSVGLVLLGVDKKKA